MSQLAIWAANKDTTVRKNRNSGATSGQGQAKHFYVGRSGSHDYDGFVKFALSWTNVGRIVSATLVIYTDDGSGDFDLTTKEHPKVVVRRLTDSFDEGNAPDGDWQTNDYTVAVGTTSDQRSVFVSRAANALNRIDVTAIVEDWAPKTVKRRNGTAGGAATNHGLGLFGTTDTDQNWAAWSRHAVTPSVRPVIELVFEYGPTTPTVSNLTPTGTVSSVSQFEGDFSDPRSTDRLTFSEVEVYDPGHAGTAGTNDLIVSNNHRLRINDQVWFTSLTGGTGLETFKRYYVIASGFSSNVFKVSTTLGGGAVNITADYSALTWSPQFYAKKKACTNNEAVSRHFIHDLDTGSLPTNIAWRWRARVWDQEAIASAWSGLLTVTATNNAPVAPVTYPVEAASYATLDGVVFGTQPAAPFSDPDSDPMQGYQVQLTAFPSGSPEWDNPESIKWDTGFQGVALGSTTYSTPYGGQSLLAGTYYHRQRVFDNDGGASAWTYRSIILTADFNQLPGSSTQVQLRPRAPWRIVVREMAFNAIGGALTAVASTDIFTTASVHGLVAGQPIRFSALTGGTGLFVGTQYYVSSVPSTTTFTISATAGGPLVDFTTNVTAGTTTAVTTRGPGRVVAILEHAHSVGASTVYNSPGEAHWTLGVDDPQLYVIEPKQTHYAIEFYTGDGWREVFAGLVWDVDASETDVVFYGLDYLALFDSVVDTRYDPSQPNKPAEKGGSYYVTAGKNSIRYIILDQLGRAVNAAKYPNSPVGFITVGSVATMSETVAVYSTYQPVLSFVTGLLDSHRQGTGKQTRIQVRKKTGGGYEVVILEVDPPVVRDNLRLRYGELVQGYRVVLFGKDWATRISGIGRTRDGIRVLYKTSTAPGISERIWGSFMRANIVDGVSDENDLQRRVKQLATRAGKLGKQLGLGLRTDVINPLDGYDITDAFPVHIRHGAINTQALGSGYWMCMAVTWEAGDQGQQSTVLTLWPREDTVAPSSDLLQLQPISPQAEWQVGWKAPDPLAASSRYWLDQSTGKVYIRDSGAFLLLGVTGTIT